MNHPEVLPRPRSPDLEGRGFGDVPKMDLLAGISFKCCKLCPRLRHPTLGHRVLVDESPGGAT